MAKMRGYKPDFWTDEKVVSVSPLARLLFLGMWNYACDNGHVEASPVQLKLRVLPMDECDVSALLVELNTAGLTVQQDGCTLIPNLSKHQRIDRRYFLECEHCQQLSAETLETSHNMEDTAGTRSAHDGPTRAPAVHTTGPRDEVRGSEGERKGEEKKTTSSQAADATNDHEEAPRDDVTRLCALLDAEMETNGTRPNGHLKRNQDAARLLLDRDQYTEEQVADIIRWSQQDEFWRSNILSMSKLRAKFDQLKARRLADKKGGLKSAPTDPRLAKGYTPDTCQRCTGLLHPTEVRAGHDRCENCRQAA